MSRTQAYYPACTAIACVALAATVVGGSHAAEVDSAPRTTAPAAIQCAEPASSTPPIPEASAPHDPNDRVLDSITTHTPAPSGESLPWGTLILGAVALQVVVSVAWTFVRHSRDG